MGSYGEKLIRFVVETKANDIPDSALGMAKLCVLDWWGVTLAGAGEPLSRILREALLPTGGGPATILGPGVTGPPLLAALLNGAASHALDYDDVHLTLLGHPSVPLIPALLALAEVHGATGVDLLTALVLGVEVECRMGAALNPGHYRAGWHATATLGRFGAAAGCARLLGLGAEGVATALGLAATQTGGIQEAFGTMAKPFQAGKAAMDGLLSALLAERGFTAPVDILDGPGFAGRLSHDWAPERLADRLGERYQVERVLFKRYPSCFATHAAIYGLLDLKRRHRFDPGSITGVHLSVAPVGIQVASKPLPHTGLEGKFSLAYCATSALLRGHVREDDFDDLAVQEPAVQNLLGKVSLQGNPAFDEVKAFVSVRTRDGELQTSVVLGEGEEPAETARALREKFLGLVSPRLGADRAGRLLEALERFDEIQRVADLCKFSQEGGGPVPSADTPRGDLPR